MEPICGKLLLAVHRIMPTGMAERSSRVGHHGVRYDKISGSFLNESMVLLESRF